MIPSSDNRVRMTVLQHFITPSLPLLWWVASPRRETHTHTHIETESVFWYSEAAPQRWELSHWWMVLPPFFSLPPTLSFLLYHAHTLSPTLHSSLNPYISCQSHSSHVNYSIRGLVLTTCLGKSFTNHYQVLLAARAIVGGDNWECVLGPVMKSCVSQPCSWRHTKTTHFQTYPNQAHLIQLIGSLVETLSPEMDVSD